MVNFSNTDGPAWRPRGELAAHPPGAQTGSVAAQFYQSQDWWHLRASIMTALQNFPDARESLIRALRSVHDLEEPNAPTQTEPRA
jgi:hypothetical protein